MPNRRQAIIWTNADPTHWCIYAALGVDELNCPIYPSWESAAVSLVMDIQYLMGDTIWSGWHLVLSCPVLPRFALSMSIYLTLHIYIILQGYYAKQLLSVSLTAVNIYRSGLFCAIQDKARWEKATQGIVSYKARRVSPDFENWCRCHKLLCFFHSTGARPIHELSLTHWGRVTYKCISTLTIIGSDNGLSPGQCKAIIWTNAGILLIWT